MDSTQALKADSDSDSDSDPDKNALHTAFILTPHKAFTAA